MTENDHRLAERLATEAGVLLKALRARGDFEGASLGAAGDLQANNLILAGLREARPADAWLSEESAPDPARLERHRVWIVDPLDGTREYGDAVAARDDWAVHVALTEGGRPTACAVALPAKGVTLSTGVPPPMPPAIEGPLRIAVSRTRAHAVVHAVGLAVGAELVPMGSAGAKAMAVVRGEVHAYVHAGGMFEWDTCAPVGVALAAGLHASRIDGSPCVYNRADTSMPDLLVCRPELAGMLLEALGRTV